MEAHPANTIWFSTCYGLKGLTLNGVLSAAVARLRCRPWFSKTWFTMLIEAHIIPIYSQGQGLCPGPKASAPEQRPQPRAPGKFFKQKRTTKMPICFAVSRKGGWDEKAPFGLFLFFCWLPFLHMASPSRGLRTGRTRKEVYNTEWTSKLP